MEDSSRKTNTDALDVEDLRRAADHVRAVAYRRNCEALHELASCIGRWMHAHLGEVQS